MVEDINAASLVYAFVCRQALDLGRVNVPYRKIVEATALDPYVLEIALDILAESKLVSAWDPGSGPCATLTPISAARLGIKLRRVDRGGRGGSHWVPISARDPLERVGGTVARTATDSGVILDQLSDQAPRPDEIAEAAEDLDASAPRRDRRLSDEESTRLPRPAVVLTGCRPWPDGFRGRIDFDGECPACRGDRLRPSVYCLVCDRWGLDWLVGRVRRSEAAAEAAELERSKARAVATRLRPKGAAVGA